MKKVLDAAIPIFEKEFGRECQARFPVRQFDKPWSVCAGCVGGPEDELEQWREAAGDEGWLDERW